MSEEETRRIAGEALAAHLELSDKTRVKTSVRNAVMIVGSIISMTVVVCGYLNRIATAQDRIEMSLAYKVPEAQLIGFANALDRMNRGVTNKDGSLGLTVPDPVAYRPQPPVGR